MSTASSRRCEPVSAPVIQVENVSKEYVLGASHRHAETLYELIGGLLSSRRRTVDTAESRRFHALRNVNFDVQPGEVMGVVGRNGAGKSTLLKILSRITAPTEGRVVMRGRVSSLLEVGTGFHPELSGRDNIFLNGSILGMKRREVERKYDEIVAFAEVEKFIDTPVKRYSSGMYVRLAFAVAAHLEPDVLIIDEVLAVGDAGFQAKCLGKISSVARGGRTVLFVSHNLQAVQTLCSRCILLDGGQIVAAGSPSHVISTYLDSTAFQTASEWSDLNGIGNEDIVLTHLAVRPSRDNTTGSIFSSSTDITVDVGVRLQRPLPGLCVGFDLIGNQGNTIFRSYNTDSADAASNLLAAGSISLSCRIPKGLLNGGTYMVAPRIGIHNRAWIVNSEPLIGFSVVLNHGESPYWDALDEKSRPGAIAPILHWQGEPK